MHMFWVGELSPKIVYVSRFQTAMLSRSPFRCSEAQNTEQFVAINQGHGGAY